MVHAWQGRAPLPFSVCVELVTPIFARSQAQPGGTEALQPAALRDHLRFWWRALHAQSEHFASEARARAEEEALWGAGADGGSRSAVKIHVDLVNPDDAVWEGTAYGRSVHAQWPSRALWSAGGSPVSRCAAGTRFWLTLVGPGDPACHTELCNAVRAWLLFGGCGERTWQGHGALTAGDRRMAAAWLPAAPTRGALTDLFGQDLFTARGYGLGNIPRLAGSRFYGGDACSDPAAATAASLGWLQQLRRLRVGARVAARNGPLDALDLRGPRRRTGAGDDTGFQGGTLVTKALPLVDGRFAPFALALNQEASARSRPGAKERAPARAPAV